MSYELDIKPGMRIKLSRSWWNDDTEYTVVKSAWYSPETQSTAVELILEGLNHVVVAPRNGIEIL